MNLNYFTRFIAILATKLVYGRKFNYLGKKTAIFSPMQIDNPKGISVGDNVFIGHNSWLFGSNNLSEANKGLFIEDNVTIGHFSHIVALSSVVIEKKVLIADKVFISDCTHSYEDVEKHIVDQKIKLLKDIRIGEGSWIGENVCICGASIGKHSVVGANTVVLKDVPDYCVVAGNPARIIKKYNNETLMWEKM